MGAKVVFLMNNLFWGGAEFQIRSIFSLCKKNGIDAYLALEEREAEVNPNIVQKYLQDNCVDKDHIFHLNMGRHTLPIAIIILYVKTIYLCTRKRIDFFFLYDQYGLWLLPLLKALRIKTIYSERNSGITTVRRFLYRIFLKSATILTCNSNVAKKNIEEKINREVLKINNYVEFPNWSWKKKESEYFTIVIPARIEPIKNQMLVLKTIHKFKEKKIRLILAGKIADKDYANQIKQYSDTNLDNTIKMELCGFVTKKESLYKEADIVILPSFSEGTPNVVLECFARKIPILASNIEQNNELIKDVGCLFSPTSKDEVYDAINYIQSLDHNQLGTLLENNYQYLKNNYGITNGPQKYIDLLK